MRRVLFQWHGRLIYSYPAMLYLGLVFGLVVENYVAILAHLNSAAIFAATLVLLVRALAGARLLFLIGAVLLWGRVPFPGSIFLYLVAGYGLGGSCLDRHESSKTRQALGRSTN